VVQPGGIGTNFSTGSGNEASQLATSQGYDKFAFDTNAIFADLRRKKLASEADMASIIHEAAVAGSGQLCHVAIVGIESWFQAGHESPKAAYIKPMG
jgi:hypothetical protein